MISKLVYLKVQTFAWKPLIIFASRQYKVYWCMESFQTILDSWVNIKTLLQMTQKMQISDLWSSKMTHFVETLMKFTDNTFLECTEISLFLCWRGWMPYNFNIVSTSILHYLFTWLYFDLYPWISHFAFSLSMMNKQNFLLLNLSWVDECILVKQNPPG